MANLTVEELLAKVAEGKKPNRRIENNANVLRFIEECKIESGTKAYPTYLIFWYYRMVWKGDRHAKANKIVFFRTFSKSFPSYRHGKQRFYLLSENFLEITPEILEKADLYDRQHGKNAHKKA